MGFNPSDHPDKSVVAPPPKQLDDKALEAAKLLPCPFCGEQPKLMRATLVRDTYHQVACQNKSCSVMASGMNALSQADAVKSWNTRAAPAASRNAVWNEAIEAAAKVADNLAGRNDQWETTTHYTVKTKADRAEMRGRYEAAKFLTDRIRALRLPEHGEG